MVAVPRETAYFDSTQLSAHLKHGATMPQTDHA
jgi:hypothetical protein